MGGGLDHGQPWDRVVFETLVFGDKAAVIVESHHGHAYHVATVVDCGYCAAAVVAETAFGGGEGIEPARFADGSVPVESLEREVDPRHHRAAAPALTVRA